VYIYSVFSVVTPYSEKVVKVEICQDKYQFVCKCLSPIVVTGVVDFFTAAYSTTDSELNAVSLEGAL